MRDLAPLRGQGSLVAGEGDEVAAGYPVVEISVERRVLQLENV